MKKPQVYFVDGSVVADKGIHLFKNVVCLYGSDFSKLEEVADVIKLKTDDKGIYCLQEEGCGSDSGEKYLIASGSISTCGLESIVSILSPVYSYKNYVEGIQGIRDILNKISGDTEINRTLLRLLFIGVCGEFEGYLHSTIIDFLIIAYCIFVIVKLFERFKKKEEVVAEEVKKNDELLVLEEIRDLPKKVK